MTSRGIGARGDQIGAIVYGGAAWWGLELLPGPRLFARAWPRILSGYAMDALGAEAAGQPIESVAQRVDAVLHARAEVFPGVGAGDDYRFGGTGVRGPRCSSTESWRI